MSERKSKNITRVEHRVSTEDREVRNRHKGAVLWFTGLSGAGKSTLAIALEEALFKRGFQVYVLDGDNVRSGLASDLGFSHEDRTENIRRVGEVAALFAHAGVICISAFISPYREDRAIARRAAGDKFLRSLRGGRPRDLRTARSEGFVQEGARRRDQGFHRHLRAVRSTGASGDRRRYQQTASCILRYRADRVRYGAFEHRRSARTTWSLTIVLGCRGTPDGLPAHPRISRA